MELDVIASLRRYWIVGIAVLIATLVVTFVATARQREMYETSAQLIVAPAAGTMDTSDTIRSLETLERRTVVATFARIAATDDTQRAVATQLGIAPADLGRFQTRGSVVPNTNIVRIDTRGPDPQRAAAIANATAQVVAREAQALYRVYVLRPLSRATPPAQAAYPDRQRNYLVGMVVGSALALASMLALGRLRGSRE